MSDLTLVFDAPTSLLHRIHADWAERGWDPAVLASFRMEEGDGGDPFAAASAAAEIPPEPADAGDGPSDGDATGIDAAAETAPADEAAPAEDAAAPTWLATQPPEVQKYVTELRQESAGYRDKWKPFRDAFDGYEDADRDIWLDAARTFKDDPVAVAEWMRDQAEAILAGAGGTDTDPTDAGAGEDTDANQPLTRADLDRYFAEQREAEAQRQAEAARAQENAAITKEAIELGYEPDTARYAALIFAAAKQTDGDLKAAHELLEADNKARLEAALNARAADAASSPRTPPPTGGATPNKKSELTFEAAREASRARRTASPIGR